MPTIFLSTTSFPDYFPKCMPQAFHQAVYIFRLLTVDLPSGFPPMLLLLFSEAPNPGTHLRSGNPLIRFAGFQKDLLVPEASDLHSGH